MIDDNIKTDKTASLTNRFIKAYSEELSSDLNLDVMNIREKSLLVSSMRSKWLIYYFKEKENLDKLKAKKKDLLEGRMQADNTNLSLLALKREESIINNDETFKRLNILIDECTKCIDFLERAMLILNDFGFSVKNAIEIIKLEQM